MGNITGIDERDVKRLILQIEQSLTTSVGSDTSNPIEARELRGRYHHMTLLQILKQLKGEIPII